MLNSNPTESYPGNTDTLSRHQSLPMKRKPKISFSEDLAKQVRYECQSDNQLETHSENFCDNEITLDRPPAIEHYRLTMQALRKASGLVRPSMAELMHGAREAAVETRDLEKTRENIKIMVDKAYAKMREKNSVEKIDFFQGVFIPVFTNIVGSLLYLRNSWVAGQAGIIAGMGTVFLSTVVIVITAVSLCGICSNGEIKRGGLYYLVSRSLGPEFGGSIGTIFSMANAMMASLYIVSVAETISDLLIENDYGFITNTRIYFAVICITLMLITLAGPDIEQSFTLFMFSLYFVSFFNWCVGSVIPPNEEQRRKGMTGYSLATISGNLLPLWHGENFISVFAVIFPGMTGLMAGSMALDKLRDPARDVPLGMLSAIGVCSLFNLIAVFISGATMLRDVSGQHEIQFNNATEQWETFACQFNETCKYGLLNYYQVAKLEALWAPLIYAGIFAMSLSSTMTNLNNGPQIFQAMCQDQLFPFVRYFSKGYRYVPERAYICFAIFTMAIIMIENILWIQFVFKENLQSFFLGDLNVINGLVSNLFLAVYASVNYACFDASFAKSPGSLRKRYDLRFRPSFRFYSMRLSLAGAVLCIIVMFIISWMTALVIFAFFFVVFIYLSRRRVDVNWGSSTQANSYRTALISVLKLTDIEEHVKNYRPQILLMIGNPASRPSLLDFTSSITKGDSLLIAAHVILCPPTEGVFRTVKQLDTQMNGWLKMNKKKAFYMPFANEDLRSGAQHLFQLSGLGKLRPNILLMGYKADWNIGSDVDLKAVDDYVGIIRDAFENNFGVGVLRNGADGFDLSEPMLQLNIKDLTAFKLGRRGSTEDVSNRVENKSLVECSSHGSISDHPSSANLYYDLFAPKSVLKSSPHGKDDAKHSSNKYSKFFSDNVLFKNFLKHEDTEAVVDEPEEIKKLSSEEYKLLHNQMNKYHFKKKNSRIDVWWLYDDGGLTLLIPHLLRLPKSYLEGARLRVFTLSSSQKLQLDQQNMAALLTKFRIEFNDLQIIPDITRKPHPTTVKCFEEIIGNMRASSENDSANLITDNELTTQIYRTHRHLRTRELFLKHSHDADLIVACNITINSRFILLFSTLPVPRIETNCYLYMGWLEALTRDLPPILLIRGNQTSVLTFYS
uniref:Solute carrier family 12 member 9 n=1 Tax=Syphacia muris TaxID=451379 RepID=A0A158R5F8_9BILA